MRYTNVNNKIFFQTRLGKVFYNMNSLMDDSIYFYITTDLIMIVIHSFSGHNIKDIFEMLDKTEDSEMDGTIFSKQA